MDQKFVERLKEFDEHSEWHGYDDIYGVYALAKEAIAALEAIDRQIVDLADENARLQNEVALYVENCVRDWP